VKYFSFLPSTNASHSLCFFDSKLKLREGLQRGRERKEMREREEMGGIPSTSKSDFLFYETHNSVLDASRSLPLLLLK
jgi:hypothetical protein